MPFLAAQVSGMSLDLVRQFPTVTTLNLGGGYKVSLAFLAPPLRETMLLPILVFSGFV